MSKAFVNTDTKRPSAFTVLLSVLWICGFLVVFFRQSITSTELSRSDVILVLIDTLLGFGDGPASPGGADLDTGLRYLPQRFPHIAVAILLLFFACVFGDAFFQCCRIRSIGTRLETLIIKLGAGLSLLSLTTLICGLAGVMDRTALPCCTFAAGSLSAFMRLRSRRPMADLMQSDQPEMLSRSADVPTRWLRMTVLFIVVPFGAYLLLGTLSPQRDFDVREYHLQGPKEWYQQGQITFLRHNVYTSFPFLSEMLLLAGMIMMGDWWSGALSGQLMLGCYQLLTAGCVYSIARRRIGIDAGWLALLIYMTTPWILRISIIAYAEGALSFYLTVAAMVALRSREQDPKHSGAFGIVCGLLAGSAMASKYTGLVSVIAPTLVLLMLPVRRSAGAVDSVPGGVSAEGTVQSSHVLPRTLFFFAAGILLAMLPWLLRNLSDTGNPVYPLGWSIFGGTEWSDEMNARWKPAHAPREGHPPGEIITRHFPDVAVRDTWTSGLLFALSVPAILLWKKIPAIRALLGLLIWGFTAWWAFTHRIDRFWIPLIPLLSVVAGSTWYLSGRYSWRLFLSSVILLVTVYNVYFCTQGLVGDHAGLTELGRAKELRIRSDFRYLNETLPTNARVLMVGEAEVFDAQFSLVYNTVFDDCIFEQMTMEPDDAGQPARSRRMRSADEILRRFADAGITHVLVNWSEILRYRAPYSYGYSDYVQPVRFQQLVSMSVLQQPKTLLAGSWADLADSDKDVVQQWDGYERLISGAGSFTQVELFVVADK